MKHNLRKALGQQSFHQNKWRVYEKKKVRIDLRCFKNPTTKSKKIRNSEAGSQPDSSGGRFWGVRRPVIILDS